MESFWKLGETVERTKGGRHRRPMVSITMKDDAAADAVSDAEEPAAVKVVCTCCQFIWRTDVS